MLVKMKMGKYCGEVLDIEPDSARRLLESGQVEVPTYGKEPEPVVTSASAPANVPTKPAKRR